ncbi:MAG: HD domain-containing protein [Deltaproteobacteria bacterium]|nr:HD domain-containing protein [Deltaproteobacteria bacterium]
MSAPVHSADIIRKYYAGHPKAWQILLEHSRRVTSRAIKIARQLQGSESLDLQFIAEAAMLHDIGIIKTNSPELGCSGDEPYLRHGVAGCAILEAEGLPRHARVCERHIGIGLTAAEIVSQGLPLPARDMLPVTLEEQIICYADLFYSKGKKNRDREKTADQVRKTLTKYGIEKREVFDRWLQFFEPERN